MEAPTERTKVRRMPKRGQYDAEVIHAILDEGFVCHVAFVLEGSPVVIPTGYARSGNCVYIHGSAASRMLRTLEHGVPVSIAVTLLDGLVLARSAFHHSMNYRSVVIFGTAVAVTAPEEKNEALRLFTEQVAPGRSRKRSAFIRTAIQKSLWEIEEEKTRAAYLADPDGDPAGQ